MRITRVEAAEVIGRDEELAAVRRFLDDENVRALVLEGEAGIGKTTLWQAGVEMARACGCEILHTRPASVEATLSLTGLVDLLSDAPGRALERLAEPQRHALAVVLGQECAEPREIDGRVLAVAFLNLLRLLAENSPLVLAIDDLQWLDRASGTVVVYALRRLGRANVRLLASSRSEPGAPLPFELTQSLGQAPLSRLALGPLSEGALRRLLHRRLGLNLSRVHAHRLYETTRGNPFHALELGRAGLEWGEAGIVLEGRDLPVLVQERLLSLPEATRDALLYVAALPRPSLRALARAGVRAELERAIEAGVLEQTSGRLRFSHPLVASALWSAADPERRREVHRALAGVVEGLEQRARQLALATLPPDPEVAALLEEAAARAQARGAPAAAAELLEQAREMTPEDDLECWTRLTAAAAAAYSEAGPMGRVAELVREALVRLPAGPERATILVVGGGMQPRPSELCLQAAEEAGETEVGVRARIALTAQAAFTGKWDDALESSETACALARRLGARDLLALALTSVCASKLLSSRLDGLEELGEALRIEAELGAFPASPHNMTAQYWRAAAALWQDDLDSARELLKAQLQRAVERGDEAALCQIAGTLANVELNAARWERARALTEEARELAEILDYRHGCACTATFLADIAAHEGDLDRARTLAEEALPVLAEMGDVLWTTLLRGSLLFLELCRGDAHAALAEAAAISTAFPDGRESLWSYHQGDEIEALVLAGEEERALRRVKALRRSGAELGLPRFLAWAERGEGLVSEARGDLDGAQAALELALVQHEKLPLRFERARTLLLYGRVLRRRKQRRAARAVIGEALAEFEQMGARHFAGVAKAELGHVGGRAPAGGGELTETEDRVARLVAAGLSNKQVAERLFVTVSAVEATLTRVYGKLGISSRSQLACARPELADDELERSPKNGVEGG